MLTLSLAEEAQSPLEPESLDITDASSSEDSDGDSTSSGDDEDTACDLEGPLTTADIVLTMADKYASLRFT